MGVGFILGAVMGMLMFILYDIYESGRSFISRFWWCRRFHVDFDMMMKFFYISEWDVICSVLDILFIYRFIRCWHAKLAHEIYRITVGLGGLGGGSDLCIWSLIALRYKFNLLILCCLLMDLLSSPVGNLDFMALEVHLLSIFHHSAFCWFQMWDYCQWR